MENIKKLKELFLKEGLSKELTSALLGNIKVESNFTPKSENMNYSSVERLRAVFPSKFKAMTDIKVKSYVNNPKALGDLVYAHLAQETINGKIVQRSGYNYRGRGLIQITGLDNYKTYSKLLGVDLVANPDLTNDLEIAGKIAVYYIKAVGFKNFKDINTNKDIKVVADYCSKSNQGVAKNYSTGFLKKHLEEKRKVCVDIYNRFDVI